jgi:sterol desaturase/sphingolipid hydroxylase (fatty acid hydroxylase superfamily)
MREEFLADFVSLGQTFTKILPISLAMAAVFTVLSSFWACNPSQPWWRKRDIVTDLCYWFFIPVIARYLRIGLLIVGAAALFRITTADGLIAFYDNGHGPLAALPLVVQMVLFLIGEDFILYWTHRIFHGQRMWRYHAVHHSSQELEWISAARFHPVNLFLGSVTADVVMLLLGISPNVFVVLGPLTIAHSAFVHANLDWTFGPFKYVIATPVFHRWHHTAPARGGEKNCRPANCPIATGSPSVTTPRASRLNWCTPSCSEERAVHAAPYRNLAVIVNQASPAAPSDGRPLGFALHS